ncbi:hypothetical protein Tco_1392000 [Tanacetum coccineum]
MVLQTKRKKRSRKADLEGDKERKIALSISKLKAARYLDFGLEELVPSLWVESERDYDISAVYGITHWWFRRKEPPTIDNTNKTSLHTAVHMWIINPGEQESSGDIQHWIESYQTKINLERPNWECSTTIYFKEDYTIVPKPRAVVYKTEISKKLMRLYDASTRFSDGTLTRVMDKAGPNVKDIHLYESTLRA